MQQFCLYNPRMLTSEQWPQYEEVFWYSNMGLTSLAYRAGNVIVHRNVIQPSFRARFACQKTQSPY